MEQLARPRLFDTAAVNGVSAVPSAGKSPQGLLSTKRMKTLMRPRRAQICVPLPTMNCLPSPQLCLHGSVGNSSAPGTATMTRRLPDPCQAPCQPQQQVRRTAATCGTRLSCRKSFSLHNVTPANSPKHLKAPQRDWQQPGCQIPPPQQKGNLRPLKDPLLPLPRCGCGGAQPAAIVQMPAHSGVLTFHAGAFPLAKS